MIKIIELFAGVGAQVAALKRLGIEYETVGISEIDRFAIQSYEAINGPTNNYGDITKIPVLDYADLWTYSFPCQDLSVADKQAGISEGTRSGLLLHVERLLETAVSSDSQPKYLLLENVKALVSKKFKSDFDRWLEKLDSLGYNNYWQVLNAKDYGVPQNRERVFVVSIRKDVDTKGYKFPEKIPLTRKLKDVLEPVVDERYYLPQEKVDKLLMNIPDTSYCIDANYYKGTTLRNYEEKHRRQLVCTPCVCGGSLDNKHTWDIVGVQHIGNINGRDSHGGFAGDIFNPEGLSPTLNTMQGGNRMPYICASRGRNPENPSDRTAGAPTEQRLEVNQTGCSNTLTSVQKDNYLLEPLAIDEQNQYIRKDGIVGTLTTDGSSPKHNNRVIEPLHIKEATQKGFADAYEGDSVSLDQPNSTTRRGRVGNQISNTLTCSCNTGVVNSYRIRKLTPLECWRLMDFTDEEFYAAQSSGVSNSQLYKQAGNSIVVAVLVGIFKNLFGGIK